MGPDIEGNLYKSLEELREKSSRKPSRELSVAITKMEEVIMWYLQSVSTEFDTTFYFDSEEERKKFMEELVSGKLKFTDEMAALLINRR